MADFDIDSRYQLSETLTEGGRDVTSEREIYAYRNRPDNILHTVGQSETWWDLAQKYYWRISSRAKGLFWVICDYQPVPVIDPTVPPRVGSTVFVPPPVAVQEEILRTKRETYL